jgi:DNA-binding SARP family transcriptional activator
VALCRQLVAGDPCREEAHRRLMRCYSRQGQPHLALRQYLACADALQRELGVDPEPATAGLADQLRGHQPI